MGREHGEKSRDGLTVLGDFSSKNCKRVSLLFISLSFPCKVKSDF